MIDIAWPIGFLLAALAAFLTMPTYTVKKAMVLVILLLWALRLGYYLAYRLRHMQGEDSRYVRIYTSWDTLGTIGVWLYLYLLQGILVIVISLPVIAVLGAVNPTMSVWDLVAGGVWGIGFALETIADYQMALFKKQAHAKDAIMDTGLWYYSRHPNYCGEIMMWWGMWLIAITVPYGIFTVISPITITYLLRYISGVPLAEETLKYNHAYQEYKKRTPTLFPWFTN